MFFATVIIVQIADTRMAGLRLPARLADFVHIQRAHRNEVADHLVSDWTMKVCVDV